LSRRRDGPPELRATATTVGYYIILNCIFNFALA